MPQMTARTRMMPLLAAAAALVLAAPAAADEACAAGPLARATYGKFYVPAYSRVLTHEGVSQALASTLAVHNVDPQIAISISLVEYHDRDGKKLKSFVEAPQPLGAYGSQEYLVPINEQAGGFGANYIVEWSAEAPALAPVVEAVMIGGAGTQGISFTSPGRLIVCRP